MEALEAMSDRINFEGFLLTDTHEPISLETLSSSLNGEPIEAYGGRHLLSYPLVSHSHNLTISNWLLSNGICSRVVTISRLRLIEFTSQDDLIKFKSHWLPFKPSSSFISVGIVIRRAINSGLVEALEYAVLNELSQAALDWMFENNIPHIVCDGDDDKPYDDPLDSKIYVAFNNHEDAVHFTLRWS